MTSVFSRLSEASATSLMCSGRLSSGSPLAFRLRIDLEAELGGDHHLVAERSESFAHEFFVRERTVHFGGIEEGDAAFDGRTNQRDPFLLVDRGTVAKAHSHAAEPNEPKLPDCFFQVCAFALILS